MKIYDWAKIGLIVISWIVIISSTFLIGLADTKTNKVEITVFNPYRLSVKLEVKCNWDNLTKKYSFKKFFLVGGKERTVIRVPQHLNKCQIWPKITF